MFSRLREKLTYANVMATVAVFLALGGGIAWALANNSVKSKHIKDGQVKTDDLSDDVEAHGFSFSAATGDDIQEVILDTRGYRISAACENVSGTPAVELILEFPQDGRLVGFGVLDRTNVTPASPSSGNGVDVEGGVPLDTGNLTTAAGEGSRLGSSQTYIGQSEAAVLNLHLLADDEDDADQCRIVGALVPGIIPPA